MNQRLLKSDMQWLGIRVVATIPNMKHVN